MEPSVAAMQPFLLLHLQMRLELNAEDMLIELVRDNPYVMLVGGRIDS